MEFGICNLSLIPLRINPNHDSEMISQLFYGETFSIIDSKNDWFKISLSWDGYKGWINKKQLKKIGEVDFEKLNTSKSHYITNLFEYISLKNGLIFPVCIGADVSVCDFLSHSHNLKKTNKNKSIRESIVKTAYCYLNAPYLWGGKSPFGIDCSGLSQMVYKINGIKLKRDANQQAEQGKTLSFIDESNQGDLAFFNDEEGKIVHVGILLNNNNIIHAHGKVRIDRIDQTGIFNSDENKHSHKLRFIKKII